MAGIAIGPLEERLGDDEIKELGAMLRQLGAPPLPEAHDDGSVAVADGLDADALSELLERLDAYDLSCEIYVPTEFDGWVEVADLRIGSAPMLLDVLEELRDELDIDDDEDLDEVDDDDFVDDGRDVLDGNIRRIWRFLFEGAQVAVERSLPLYILS